MQRTSIGCVLLGCVVSVASLKKYRYWRKKACNVVSVVASSAKLSLSSNPLGPM